MPSDTDRVRDAYDARPWPAPGVVQGPALPDHWVNAATAGTALGPGARILVAGCGTGGEVASFASRYPGATVVGVDVSERSIAQARRAWPELSFVAADLGAWQPASDLGSFDFISCHAVADYVPEGPRLLENLAHALADGGVLYLGTNSVHHPGARIRAAMARLGLQAGHWEEGPVGRAGLRAIGGLAGEGMMDLASQLEGQLAADVFPAFSHAVDLATWRSWAAGAGLSLAGSLASLWALPRVGDGDLPLLYGLDRGGLAELVEELQQNAVLQLVFAKDPAPAPPWRDLDALWGWRATLHPSLGREHLPELRGDWMTTRFIAVGTPGLPELRLNLSAWMLELYRRCDGRPLGEVRAQMPVAAHHEHLRASLYRFWQAGLVQLSPGQSR